MESYYYYTCRKKPWDWLNFCLIWCERKFKSWWRAIFSTLLSKSSCPIKGLSWGCDKCLHPMVICLILVKLCWTSSFSRSGLYRVSCVFKPSLTVFGDSFFTFGAQVETEIKKLPTSKSWAKESACSTRRSAVSQGKDYKRDVYLQLYSQSHVLKMAEHVRPKPSFCVCSERRLMWTLTVWWSAAFCRLPS